MRFELRRRLPIYTRRSLWRRNARIVPTYARKTPSAVRPELLARGRERALKLSTETALFAYYA